MLESAAEETLVELQQACDMANMWVVLTSYVLAIAILIFHVLLLCNLRQKQATIALRAK